ncbi:hypothetical protein GCM10028784_13610 [Myceligenerans cantabricum]
MATRVVYEREDGTWGWRLKGDNGKIIATDGNQGYESEEASRKMADSIIGGDYANADKKRSPQKGAP